MSGGEIDAELHRLARPQFAMLERIAPSATGDSPPPWRSPKCTGVDLSPWHASRILTLLQTALGDVTVDVLLRTAHCLFLCSAESRLNRDALRRIRTVVEIFTHVFRRSDGSSSGARIKEHLINAMALLLGEDASFDDNVAFDLHWLPECVAVALLDQRHVTVVMAAARFIRRVSELSHPSGAARQLVWCEQVFCALLQQLETCGDRTVKLHLICALLNLSSDPRLHFALARCQRLLRSLLSHIRDASADRPFDEARETQGENTQTSHSHPTLRPGLVSVSPLSRFSTDHRHASTITATPRIGTPRSGHADMAIGSTSVATRSSSSARTPHHHSSGGDAAASHAATAADLCELALRIIANLVSSEEQCTEMLRLAPELVDQVLQCRASHCGGKVSATADEVLRLVHDHRTPQLEYDVALELFRATATARSIQQQRGMDQSCDDLDGPVDFDSSHVPTPRMDSAVALVQRTLQEE